jgi:DNA-binding GntR family transcriptional regulator
VTAAERVYRGFYEEVRRGRLAPGTILHEEALAERYGVSRTPVREALRRLTQDGVVERRGSRLMVGQPTQRQVEEIYPIVSLLEGLAARLAAQRIDAATLRRLRRLNERMRKASVEADRGVYVEANQEFHDLVVAMAGNEELAREVARFRTITAHLRVALLDLPGRREESVVQHDELLAALEAHDSERAEAINREHVESGQRYLVGALAAATLLGASVGATQPSQDGSRSARS